MTLSPSSFAMQAQRAGTGAVPGTGPRASGSLGKQFAGDPHGQESGRQARSQSQGQEDGAVGFRPQSRRPLWRPAQGARLRGSRTGIQAATSGTLIAMTVGA